MCGITGFIDFSKATTSLTLEKMTDTLYHRGPDGRGTQVYNNKSATIGFGHRRLSIIDLSEAGAQPMNYKHLSITFNGEIYNYQEIKRELESLGHIFLSHSDTEVILHAFEQWGIECLQKFTGMFAFVLFNASTSEIFCVRDRAGVKPFFYYWHNQLFLFASELKAFHQHPLFKKEINDDAVAAFMQFGNIPAPHCIFNHTYKLSPGHYLKFNFQQPSFQINSYWSVYDSYNQAKLKIDFNEAKTETEKILSKAFNYRMVADVPVGIFLSGGYDSACVTALLQKDKSQKLKTYTISVPDIGLNEAPYAKQVADILGTEHFEYSCSQKEALELIKNLPLYYDEPFADSSAIPTSLVCLMARKQVTVALSADGGDEVFAGYNRYDYLMKYGPLLNKMPKAMRRFASGIMEKVPSKKIPILKNKYNFHNRYNKLRNLLVNPSTQNMMKSLSTQFSDEELKYLMTRESRKLPDAYSSEALLEEYYSPLSYMMAIDYETYLPDDILQKVDRASMSASLEAREPFIDHDVIKWAARLPNDFKYNNGVKKYILREIVHQYVPKTVMERPKMGFAIPIERWLISDLKSMLFQYLDETKIEKQGIFNPEYIKELKLEFLNGKYELAVKIWFLLMFQLWYEKWME